MAYINFIVTSLSVKDRIIITNLYFNFIMKKVSSPLSFLAKQLLNENTIVSQFLFKKNPTFLDDRFFVMFCMKIRVSYEDFTVSDTRKVCSICFWMP